MKRIEYSVRRDPTTNWVLGPVAACIDYLAVEIAMSGVMIRGLELMPLVAPLMKVAAPEIARKRGRKALRPFQEFLAADMSFSGMSERLAENDYALANSHTLVALWSGLETCIEDTIVLALLNDSPSVEAVGREVKIRGHESGLLDERQARRTYRSLESKARQDRSLATAYDWMLGLVDLERTPRSNLGSSLDEANALRNAIMHNAGVADEKMSSSAPSLGLSPGERIELSRDRIRSYNGVISSFVQELLAGVIRSRHIKSKEQLDVADA